MKAVITPSPLKGFVDAPASKSAAHRALICAALADKPTKIICSTTSVDIQATAQCLRELGATITATDYGMEVEPIEKNEKECLEEWFEKISFAEKGKDITKAMPLRTVSFSFKMMQANTTLIMGHR